MSLQEIQIAVESLSADERKALTSWIVDKYPILEVDGLMFRAQRMVDAGQWTPKPPGDDNIPKGEVLSRALKTAEGLGLKK